MVLNDADLYYSLDDADLSAGEPQDISGNSNHGTKVGPPTTGATGKIDEAFDFNGTSDKVTFTSTITLTGAFGISWWAKIDAKSTTTNYALQYGDSASSASYAGYKNTGSTPQIVIAIATAEQLYNIGSEPVADATLHHYAFTRDGSNDVRAYYDGSEIGSPQTNSGNFVVNQLAQLQTNASFFFNGIMDEVAIYSRLLSGAEITSLYNSGSGFNLSKFNGV